MKAIQTSMFDWVDSAVIWVVSLVIAALIVLCIWQRFTIFEFRTDIANMNAAAAKASVEAQDQVIMQERQYQVQLSEANQNAATREKNLQTRYATLSRTAVGLRDANNKLRQDLSRSSDVACAQGAAALSDVFGECSGEYESVAKQADQCFSDRQLLIESWPRSKALTSGLSSE